jgi:ABC-type glycerol-3-phosphate transport system permease component
VADWTEFKRNLPPNFLITTTIDPLYRRYLREDVYEDDLAKLNATWGTDYASWIEITLPRKAPATPAARRADWEKFVREKFPLRMLGMEEKPFNEAWRAFRSKKGRTTAVPAVFDAQARADEAEIMATAATSVPVEWLSADSPENLWRSAHHLPETVQPPQAVADWQFATANAGMLRADFAGRNFRTVAGYILLHGRAVMNTVIFCVLAILGAIIVNPLCAYALSRYPLPYAYKVLLFVLATMAFPAEVAMIPNFLLLKDLGMLNTFWALVLPGLASGFSIFLLKGFFDSLPKELYEAGILDGASEVTMFRRITVPLSLPIFSVIALNAFTASYGAFLFAMVVCQDPKMWTLMVWLYDLQSAAPQYVIMAALTLAALPTLIVFLFAQKVILRGIILPSFK